MKRIYTKILMLSSLAAVLASCAYDPYKTDIPKVEETMNLSASVESFALTEDNLDEVAVSFSWTPARQLSEEYLLTYTAELDVVGNNFGSTTVITSGTGFDFEYDEGTGMYSCSFTGEQINNWYNDRWKLPVNASFSLEFRVIASWTGGPTYEMPEVRRVTVNATPIQVIIFDADEMSLSGTAISTETEINPTLENTNQYAWYGALTPGELFIPVKYDGVDYYIYPTGDGTLKDGQPDEVNMGSEARGWNIPEAGNYRVVVNMEQRTVTIYSAATDLQPKSVTFYANGVDTNPEITVVVTDFWRYGDDAWKPGKKMNCTQSLADPQIFIYEGNLKDRVSFRVSSEFTAGDEQFTIEHTYSYTCPLAADGLKQEMSITLDKACELHGGADNPTRNSYYRFPDGNYRVIINLRAMTVFATSID